MDGTTIRTWTERALKDRLVVALTLATAAALMIASNPALAHNVAGDDARFVEAIDGPAIGPFLYLGAKHMVTGLDHVLFIVGVVFFLHRLRDVAIYASMFTLGHSITLISGVLADTHVNAYLVDAVIGFSVAYKAFENMGGFKSVIPFSLDTRVAVFGFGLAHGLGLATKLSDLTISKNGLLTNLLSFNVGVEIGQVLVLVAVVTLLNAWRSHRSFIEHSFVTNALLMTAGFVLAGSQIAGYVVRS